MLLNFTKSTEPTELQVSSNCYYIHKLQLLFLNLGRNLTFVWSHNPARVVFHLQDRLDKSRYPLCETLGDKSRTLPTRTL